MRYNPNNFLIQILAAEGFRCGGGKKDDYFLSMIPVREKTQYAEFDRVRLDLHNPTQTLAISAALNKHGIVHDANTFRGKIVIENSAFFRINPKSTKH